jgi:dGTPase
LDKTFDMNWTSLLSAERLSDPNYAQQNNRSIFVQDYDRIVFSAPFRRLANKTQVQPLYENDHVHHRLIHSIEVSSIGRSLAMQIGRRLADEEKIDEPQVYDLADIVQAACVAHDIGNPPFGHSGEVAMGAWYSEQFGEKQGIMADLPAERRSEFTNFEGNAQGFRILTRLEMYRGAGGMRLSKATLGAFTKYPVTAADLKVIEAKAQSAQHKARSAAQYVGLKKFGVFHSDLPQFLEAANTLGLPETTMEEAKFWGRHPLAFVMEAADDITYNIVDLEDAFVTGELSFQAVRETLLKVAGKLNSDTTDQSEAEQIAYLRARSIGSAVDACVEAFMENYDEIMQGTFSDDLISASSLGAVFSEIKKLAREGIFTAPRKTELEISGRRIIANVMSGILPVYEELARGSWDKDSLSAHSKQLVRALSLDLRDVSDVESALHAHADFISGMTDRYALRISRMLSGT